MRQAVTRARSAPDGRSRRTASAQRHAQQQREAEVGHRSEHRRARSDDDIGEAAQRLEKRGVAGLRTHVRREGDDLIVVGSGPGGASLAHRLASSGKRILILERGDYLPRETQNWSSSEVFVHGRYQARETWYTAAGRAFEKSIGAT